MKEDREGTLSSVFLAGEPGKALSRSERDPQKHTMKT
jgi:hypothetical protein